MNRFIAAIAVALLAGCAHMMGEEGGAWTNMSELAQWNQIGDANWRAEGGAMVADKGNGFLVSKSTYKDFELKVEFYAEHDTNSGVFIRCQDPKKVVGNASENSYEVNIWDDRPKAEHGTGAIVDIAAVVPMPKAGGKWNTYHITAKGDHFVVVFNGQKTVDVHNAKHASGYIALQHAPGVKDDRQPIKFRKVEVRAL
jgi:hypothetical protein